jgi:transposase
MLFAKVTKAEQKELKSALEKSENIKLYRRLKIIDLSSQNKRVPELASLFDLSEATIRTYIKKYNQGGLAGLKPKEIPGKEATITLTKEEWEELLKRSPSQFDLLKTKARNWTQKMMQDYLAHYHEIKVNQGTISYTLKKLGISWKRSKKK